MRKIIVTLLIVLSAVTGHAQAWVRQYWLGIDSNALGYAYDGRPDQGCYSFDPATGGIISGTYGQVSPLSNYDSAYLFRVSRMGDSLWTIKRLATDAAYSEYRYNALLATNDSVTTLAGGYAYQNSNSTQCYLINKYNAAGQVTATKSIPLFTALVAADLYDGPYYLSSLRQVGNNFYALLEYIDYYDFNTMPPATEHIVLYKLDNNLNTIWADTVQENTGYFVETISYQFEFPAPFTLAVTADSGCTFAAVSDTSTYPQNAYLTRLYKCTAAGNVQWSMILNNVVNDTNIYFYNPPLPTADSGEIIEFSHLVGTNMQQVRCIMHLSATGTIVDSFTLNEITGNLNVANGILASNGDAVFQFGYGPNTIGNGGRIRYDQHLHFKSLIPDFDPYPGYGYRPVFPNNVGGGYVAYIDHTASYDNHFLTVMSYDSTGSVAPSTVSGMVDYDLNPDCLADAGDLPMPLRTVIMGDTTGHHYYAFTDSAGMYAQPVMPGYYTMATNAGYNKAVVCPAGGIQQVAITAPAAYTGYNFYERLLPNLTDVSVTSYASLFVAGYNATIYYQLRNTGSLPVTDTFKVMVDPALSLTTSMPAPVATAGNTYSFAVTALQPDSMQTVTMVVYVPPTAYGNSVTISSGIPLTGDATPNNNVDTVGSTVVGSFDPNEKSVNRPLHCSGDQELVYHVEFQNTGTYPARTVLVTDAIDSHLDLSTFRLIAANPATPAITWHEGNVLYFSFPDINLPDSNSNEPASHGSFTYGIMPAATAHAGDAIFNKASIYFDYNLPIVTNTTHNILKSAPSAIATVGKTPGGGISLYPNPSTGLVNIEVQSPALQTGTLVITDVYGRIVKEQSLKAGEQHSTINLGSNAAGIYYYRLLVNGNMQSSGKLMIMK